MSFIGATGLNTFDEEIENTSNYASRISLDSSNYTSNVNFNSSNYTGSVSYFSNCTGRIEEELGDRIESPASLLPFVLPSGVYIPIKAQELEIAQVAQLVGAHTGANFGKEQQIAGIVGTVGGAGGLIGGAIATAGSAVITANNAYSKAQEALTKANNLIVSTTTDKADTSNYIIDTSNVTSTRITNLNSGSVPTVANVFPLLYKSHFEQISDGLNPNQISIKNIN